MEATDAADYLVRKGLPFREAYNAVGRLVAECISSEHTLETLPLEDYQKLCPLFDGSVYDAVRLEACVAGRKLPGGPAPEAVTAHIEHVRKFVQLRVKSGELS